MGTPVLPNGIYPLGESYLSADAVRVPGLYRCGFSPAAYEWR